MTRIPGWDCADGTTDEDHDWTYKCDWEGDPGVINGTNDIFYRVCEQCGKEEPCSSDAFYSAHDDNDGFFDEVTP